MKNYFLTIADH